MVEYIAERTVHSKLEHVVNRSEVFMIVNCKKIL